MKSTDKEYLMNQFYFVAKATEQAQQILDEVVNNSEAEIVEGIQTNINTIISQLKIIEGNLIEVADKLERIEVKD